MLTGGGLCVIIKVAGFEELVMTNSSKKIIKKMLTNVELCEIIEVTDFLKLVMTNF